VRLETTLLGTPVSMPLGVAPFAMQSLLVPAGECETARAAAELGVLMCVSTLTTCTHAEIAEVGGGPRWLQLYVLRDRQQTLDHIAVARESGYSAVVVTVDLPYVGRRERDLRLGFANPPPDLHLPYAHLFATTRCGSRTTAAASSTVSRPASTRCPRSPKRSTAVARSTSTAASAAAATS
jgi:isopentenyl diphosphate isomerase/L-lactate dehydrogenase-like FMN-dependent dehydrogenase